jgi:hypothetical protein
MWSIVSAPDPDLIVGNVEHSTDAASHRVTTVPGVERDAIVSIRVAYHMAMLGYGMF